MLVINTFVRLHRNFRDQACPGGTFRVGLSIRRGKIMLPHGVLHCQIKIRNHLTSKESLTEVKVFL